MLISVGFVVVGVFSSSESESDKEKLILVSMVLLVDVKWRGMGEVKVLLDLKVENKARDIGDVIVRLAAYKAIDAVLFVKQCRVVATSKKGKACFLSPLQILLENSNGDVWLAYIHHSLGPYIQKEKKERLELNLTKLA